jgi:threo-3-hydroxy-L-aspartate ammonia-lyase
MPTTTHAITYADIEDAAERLHGVAHRTPLHTARTVDALVGAEVIFKCENFQRMGAFKFRGAYNAISRLSEAEKARGVITYSSGNHAQAVALTAQLLGINATIVMPTNAPQTKRAATEGYGATVVPYDPTTGDRKTIAEDLAAQHGYVIIPPFDHPHVIAGQGTAAKELHEDTGRLDALLVCCGGGGLLSGCAIATRALAPGCKIIGVEPEAGDDATRSFHSGTLQSVHNPPTIADGARTASLGDLTWPIVRDVVDDMVTVSDDALLETVRLMALRMKMVVEPSGALAAAALLNGKVQVSGRVGVLISGGNIDAALLSRALSFSPG